MLDNWEMPPRWARIVIPFLLLGGISLIYDYPSTFFKRPQSTHQWRQCDCASFALRYYQDDRGFFQPANHVLTSKDGNAVSEFPLTFFLSAQLYRLFGPEESIIRMLHTGIMLLGLWCLFLMTYELTGRYWLSWLPPVLVFTTPVLVFYTNNFLSDAPALGLTLIGWYFFVRYWFKGHKTTIWFSLGILTLASLIKIVSFVSLGSVLALLGLAALGWVKAPHTQRPWWPMLVGGSLGLGAVALWMSFVFQYNEVNHTHHYLLDLNPIWRMSKSQINAVYDSYFSSWGKWEHVHSPIVLALPALLITLLVMWWRQLAPSFKWIVGLMSVGHLAYLMMWYQQLGGHDYYLVPSVIWPMWLLVVVLSCWSSAERRLPRWAGIALIVVAAAHIPYAAYYQWDRYHGKIGQAERSYMGVRGGNPDFFTIEPQLRNWGISLDDQVFSIPDISPNISLYLMNQYGWTEAFNGGTLPQRIEEGTIDYIVVSDSSTLNSALCAPYLGPLVGRYRSISVYQAIKD